MAAIELASTEGFTRSAADVSLRRLAHYSLSPVDEKRVRADLRAAVSDADAFRGGGRRAPRTICFCEWNMTARCEQRRDLRRARQDFAVLSGTRQSVELMEAFLKSEHKPDASFETQVNSALDAWSVGHMLLQASEAKRLPARDAIAQHRQEQLACCNRSSSAGAR
jgi:hypothetical protein